MSKLLIRLTVVGVALYLVVCYVIAILFGIDIWSQTYYLLFELCVCLCISKQGVYHCKFIKYTAYSIFVYDTLNCLDTAFDIFPTNFIIFIPPIIISLGLLTTTTLAIRHYIKVRKTKRRAKLQRQTFPQANIRNA
jgi:ABC-type Na+ efflux pump permease subunit